MFTTVGVCVVVHYCGGELEKVSLFSKPSSCCDGEDDETDDCCKNDVKHVTFQQDFTFYKLVTECKVPVVQFTIFDFRSFVFNFTESTLFTLTNLKDFPPPNLVQRDIVSSSVLRI